MTEPISSTGNLRKYIDTREIILHVRQRRWRYFLIILLLGAYFFYVFKYHVLDYSSTASFVVNEPNLVVSSELGPMTSTGDNFNRIYELANSIPTQRHMIIKFSLLEHYRIDSTDEFYFEKAVARLRSKFTLKKSPFNTISITVSDRYRYLAAEMANEMVAYIERQNQEYYSSRLRRRIQIAEAYIAQVKKESHSTAASIDSMIIKIDKLVSNRNTDERNAGMLSSYSQQLGILTNSFENSTTELINSQKLYNLSLQALNFQVFPTLNIIQMAMPAYRSTTIMAMTYSILAMVLVFMLLILQGYLFMNYREYIRLIINGK